MFDRVRIRSASITHSLGFAGKVGLVYGVTTPSDSGVQVVGDSGSDAAVAVRFDERAETIWFDPSLVEFVDHAPGTTVKLGNRRLVRTERGDWIKVESDSTDY